MKNKSKFAFVLTMALFVAGCTNESKPTVASSSSEKPVQSAKASSSGEKPVQSAKTSSVKKYWVGDVISSKPNDPNVAYKMANKHVKFYRSLKSFGKKSGVISDYQEEKGGLFGVKQIVTTSKGKYYHIVGFNTGGFEKDADGPDDLGYVAATDFKRVKAVKAEWTYSQKKPYYIADPNSHRIWNHPAYTVAYAYITHVFDRLTTQQLYATKELITNKGKHYVYLETAKGRQLGWVYKAYHTLIAGKYRDPGEQLLTVKKHEKLVTKVQSRKSTGNRVGVNDSLSLRQRAYLVVGPKKQISRILVISMDNRPTKIYFHHGRATRVKTYTYRRKSWKSSTNKKKMRTKYLAEHAYSYLSVDAIQSKFYGTSNKKLVRVNTLAFDGYGSVIIYRNGKVKFITGGLKETYTYPLTNFK